MPASPATPRRSSNSNVRRSAPATPKASENKGLGIYSAVTITDRIREWQEHGATIIAPADPSSDISNSSHEDEEIGEKKEKAAAPTPRGRGLPKPNHTTSKRKTPTRWVDPENREWVRKARTSGTPKKRVISDEHWKKDRPAKEPHSAQSTPRRLPRHEEEVHNPSHDTLTREEKDERRRRRRKTRSPRTSEEPKNNDDGIRVYATQPTSRRNSAESEPVSDDNPYLQNDAEESFPRRPSGRQSPKQSTGPQRRTEHSPLEEYEQSEPKRSHYAETLEKSPSSAQGGFGEPLTAVRSKKGRIFSQAKEIFTKSEAVPTTGLRIPSIEAWLEEQPDPFLDAESPLLEDPPVEVPAPLKTKSRRRKTAVEETIQEDPTPAPDPVEPHRDPPLEPGRSSHRRRRRSEKSIEDDRTPVMEFHHAVTDSKRRSPVFEEQKPRAPDRSPVVLRRKAKSSITESDDAHSKEPVFTPKSRKLPEIPFSTPEEPNSHQTGLDPRPRLQRPCPPTGLHRLSTIASVETFQSRTEIADDPDMLARDGNGLKRRLTTHEDLMSVLSQPRATKTRSIRTTRSRPGTTSLEQVFEELASDESKYMRELRTLVDGVIPVLLKCVLSKSDSVAAAGLFTSSGNARDDLNFTKPIVEMGIALERLKMLHMRIPMQNLDSLLSWAVGAQKVYAEYLNAWRLGFQDVIVNLAPADGNSNKDIDEGMARDENGDIINADGKKVDVAYLLKRPLIRIKNLGKVFNSLKVLKPSPKLAQIAVAYDDLVATARKRSNEEQGRLEDEAAGNIDATKARDLRTLAVLSNVEIDKTRRVNARDCFNLTLRHSTGQMIDCRVELLLRENPPEGASGGDLLLCEVEDSGRWLFFPPIDRSCLSARMGAADGDLVVMVRGNASRGRKWHELLCLKADYAASALEWVYMLGLQPVPPAVHPTLNFIDRQQDTLSSPRPDATNLTSSTPFISRAPSPRDIEVPIGETSVVGDCEEERPSTAPGRPQHEEHLQNSNPTHVSEHSRFSIHHVISSLRSSNNKPLPPRPRISSEGIPLPVELDQTATDLSVSSEETRSGSTPALRRTKAARGRNTRNEDVSPPTSLVADSPIIDADTTPDHGLRKLSRTDNASREWMSSPDVTQVPSPATGNDAKTSCRQEQAESRSARPEYHRTLSSTPSKDPPTIPRTRPNSQASTPLNDAMRDEWAALSAVSRSDKMKAKTLSVAHPEPQPSMLLTEAVLTPPSTATLHSPSRPKRYHPQKPVPPQNEVQPHQQKSWNPSESKAKSGVSSRSDRNGDRRSSSPLKHEYAPSVASDTSSDSESESSITSSSSDTSEDAVIEYRDVPTDLVSIGAATHKPRRINPPASVATLPSATLAPSNSASQAPYRTVPSGPIPSGKSSKTIAIVCSWSEKGIWESLHPDECSIVVSPGLIEAYEMSADQSGPKGREVKVKSGTNSEVSSYIHEDGSELRPLVGFELTPLVPLRRGTALDISIRSPPTEKSKIRTTNNIMFRSRNAEDCEILYSMINYARINNPTYIALQNARPSYQPPVTFNTGNNRRGSRSKAGSWFSFGSGSHAKQSSYRASSAAMPSSASIGGMSESSIGSMSSAFSALRRFGGAKEGKGMFNLNRSSVLKKKGPSGRSGSASLYSSSSGTTWTGGSGSGANSPAPSQLGLPLKTPGIDPQIPENIEGGDAMAAAAAAAAAGAGGVVNNMKIRLYIRQADLWKDLGAGRLSVLQPPAAPAPDPIPLDNPSAPIAHLATTKDLLSSTPPGIAATTAAGDGESRGPSSASASASTPTATTPPGSNRIGGGGPRLPSSSHTPHRIHGDGREKRIVIAGKTHLLLDVLLGESCFERVGRIGIALTVWMEDQTVKKEGGVLVGRGQMYMIQMNCEAECSWVFGLVGRARY